MEAQKENFNHKHAKSSWMSASDDFTLIREFAEVGAREGSIDSIMKEGKYGQFLAVAGEPPQGMSDFRSCITLVYAIYNGIELYLKAYEYAAYPERAPKAPPKFCDLLARYQEAPWKKDDCAAFIDRYTGKDAPELLQRFLKASGLSVEELLVMRRQINNANFFSLLESYKPLLYSPEEGKEFFAALEREVTPLMEDSQAKYKDIDDDGVPGDVVAALAQE
ncbi:MAG: hypothetical protein LBG81_06500 [Coriobacteriaceae bacterium]|jgi:hypothetical protein|nr:hypothetical protein [Coriobacteriaceae bacterium]